MVDRDIKEIWADVAHKFPARDAQVFENLLASNPPVMDVDRLFELLMQSGLYGGARRALAPETETRYSTPRKKQMYIGSAFARLNKRLQKHGVPARIIPGQLKQTYILHIDE
jgi:hypothetical protein